MIHIRNSPSFFSNDAAANHFAEHIPRGQAATNQFAEEIWMFRQRSGGLAETGLLTGLLLTLSQLSVTFFLIEIIASESLLTRIN